MKKRINYDAFLTFEYAEKEKGILEKEKLLKEGYKVIIEGISEDETCFFELRKQEKYESGILVETKSRTANCRSSCNSSPEIRSVYRKKNRNHKY